MTRKQYNTMLVACEEVMRQKDEIHPPGKWLARHEYPFNDGDVYSGIWAWEGNGRPGGSPGNPWLLFPGQQIGLGYITHWMRPSMPAPPSIK
jgi:hypothetical protein